MKEFEANRSRLPTDACENLCTKTMYMAAEDPDEYEEDAGIPTASFWCALNQMPYGPDDRPVGPESCRPGRTCCIPRLPARP